MFLSRRTKQAEYFDAERPAEEWREFFASLRRMNRWFGFAEPFKSGLPKLLGPNRCGNVSLLDVGAGDGSMGEELKTWAGRQGWDWRVTNLDSSPAALSFAPRGTTVVGSALRLPVADRSFDVVIASQMTHHLDEPDAVTHLREAWRAARHAIMISDLHRNLGLYACLWVTGGLGGFPRHFLADSLISVKRAWRVPELARLAAEAGIPNATAKLYFGARVLLTASRDRP